LLLLAALLHLLLAPPIFSLPKPMLLLLLLLLAPISLVVEVLPQLSALAQARLFLSLPAVLACAAEAGQPAVATVPG
jgi:hypothetical protein